MAVASTLLGSAVFKVGASSGTTVDYSDNTSDLVVNIGKESLDASSFGGTIRYNVGGLSTVQITATLLANATILNALYALVGTNCYVSARRDSSAASATNLNYNITGTYFESLDVVNQAVGELSEVEVVFTGASTIATSST